MNKQQIKVNDIDWSTFDLSHINRTSFDMGQLVPIVCMPTLPKDKFKITVSNFIRAMPTKVPMIDGLDLKINHFYVPKRCLWNGFEQFITQGRNGRIDVSAIPQVALENVNPGNYKNGRLADYLGLGDVSLDSDDVQYVSAMPFLAYQKIYLDHYAPKRWINYANPDGTAHNLALLRDKLEEIRDGNGNRVLQSILENDPLNLGQIRHVNWNHDYFTNALPSPTLFADQKLPLFTTNLYEPIINANDNEYYANPNGDIVFSPTGTPQAKANYASMGTIKDLRTSISMQHYLEKLQQGDGGYLETMKIHWNQDLPNDLLQRSEYLGGDVTTIFHNEVESNADTVSEASGQGKGLGDLAGKPIGGGTDDSKYMDSDEFGIYMAIAHVVPKRSYADAVHKMWLQDLPLDFPNPDFENIGDQAVYRYELTGNFQEQSIWGFVPRYSEYKTALDRFSGEMRHTLKDWHFGTFKEELEQFPTISPEFMEAHVREDIFQVVDEPDKLLGTFSFNIKAQRPLQHTSQAGIGYI